MKNENIGIEVAVDGASAAPQGTESNVTISFEYSAVRLTEAGLSVIPLKPQSKEPAIHDWQNNSTRDINQIKKWQGMAADFNVGVVAKWDGFWFLDIDDADLEKKIEEDTGNSLPRTFCVQSSKGRHLYFRHTQLSRAMHRNKFQLKDQEGKLLGDVQLNNAYVVGPGSLHESGKRYEILDTGEIIAGPEWLVNWLTAQTQQTKSCQQHPHANEGKVKQGSRDNFLFQQACALRKSGLSEKTALLSLQVINTEQCEPPLSPDIVEQKIKSAYKNKPALLPTPKEAPAQEAEVVPPASEVNGTILLTSLEDYFTRYAVLEKGLPLVLALWSLATYLFSAFDTFSYLAITSPTKRCGKSRTGELLELVCANAESTVQISQAALFRMIEQLKPTLIIDEAESLGGRGETTEALRAILNVGYRKGKKVRRSFKKSDDGNFDTEGFETFCPKAIILIGNLPDTLHDRCIPIRMKRRTNETLSRFRFATAKSEAAPLKAQMTAWATANLQEVVKQYLENDLTFLLDRDAELWLPLFSVLAIADPNRRWELETTASQLCQAKDSGEPTEVSLKLLGDLRQIFATPGTDEDQLSSKKILTALLGIEESPWKDWRGKGLTLRNLAELLRPYGITPQNARIEKGKVGKVYRKEDFTDCWNRYLTQPVSQIQAKSDPANSGDLHQSVSQNEASTEPAGSDPGIESIDKAQLIAESGAGLIIEIDDDAEISVLSGF